MVQRTVIVRSDDIDGTPASRSIEFTIDGVSYTIDLSEEHAGEFDAALDPWIRHARRTSKPRGTQSPVAKGSNDAVRAWARANGHQISDRGRISAAITEAYAARRQ